jgi:hypothetical protein
VQSLIENHYCSLENGQWFDGTKRKDNLCKCISGPNIVPDCDYLHDSSEPQSWPMAPNPVLFDKARGPEPTKKTRPIGISTPLLFGAFVVSLMAGFRWPWYWLLSGAPFLTISIWLGAYNGYRVLPHVSLWTLLPTLNLAAVVASTSWLLCGVFMAGCYPLILLSALYQSPTLADFVRRQLRRILTKFQFVKDTISLFDIPGLEIDTEVDGLMVVRGVTFSISNLTLIAHGVEVAIKLADDMELALQTEMITVRLFRRINISPVYANLKIGESEMTFANLEAPASDKEVKTSVVSNSAMLDRALATGDPERPLTAKNLAKTPSDDGPLEDNGPLEANGSLESIGPLESNGPLEANGPEPRFNSITKPSSDNTIAMQNYEDMVRWIKKTNLIYQCNKSAEHLHEEQQEEGLRNTGNGLNAMVSVMLHSKPSIPHPSTANFKVSTLRKRLPPRVERLLHRLPMLLRILLGPLGYFHPVNIESVTAAGSGKWISSQLDESLFQDYTDNNAELRRLHKRVLSWLSDANFVISLENITGQGSVHLSSENDISCYLSVSEARAYRTSCEGEQNPIEVVRVSGADLTFLIPSFLLPHHEHLLPPIPTMMQKEDLAKEAVDAPNVSDTVQLETELEQLQKDEANVQASFHARLPATFDQQLLDFIAVLVKATKVIELEKEAQIEDDEPSNAFRELTQTINKGMKDGMKKAVTEGIVNDRWIAKMVGRIMKRLQTAQGEVGYSGAIPVALAPYRLPDGHVQADKILA